MKIANLELEIIKQPEDLARQIERLLSATVAEVHAMLARAAIADHVAAALIPFVKDPPPRIAIATAIAEHGVVYVRQEVRKLYADVLGVVAEPDPEPPATDVEHADSGVPDVAVEPDPTPAADQTPQPQKGKSVAQVKG